MVLKTERSSIELVKNKKLAKAIDDLSLAAILLEDLKKIKVSKAVTIIVEKLNKKG